MGLTAAGVNVGDMGTVDRDERVVDTFVAVLHTVDSTGPVPAWLGSGRIKDALCPCAETTRFSVCT